MVHELGSVRLSVEISSAIAWTKEHASELKVPLLILHGGADRLVLPEVSASFFDKVQYQDKQRNIYDGAYHELDNDLCSDEVLSDLVRWIREHIHHE